MSDWKLLSYPAAENIIFLFMNLNIEMFGCKNMKEKN